MPCARGLFEDGSIVARVLNIVPAKSRIDMEDGIF